MIATLFFAAAVNVAAPSSAVDDFKSLCVATKADVAAVTAAAAAQGAWSAPAATDQEGLTAWTYTGEGVERSLIAGVQDAPDGKRQICMVASQPAQPGLSTSITGALGGVSMPVDANAGLYAYAPSAEAYNAGDVTFVSVTSEADSTSLTAIRPVK